MSNVKSMKLSKYFTYITTKDQLAYYRIIPHYNTRNYNNIEIPKTINKCYRNVFKQFKRDNKGFCFEEKTKIAYYIYLDKKEGIQFYMVIPKVHSSMFLDKISAVWDKVEVREVNNIPRFSKNAYKAVMKYEKNDGLSLGLIDKRKNDFLDSQLNVFGMMEEDDHVGIFYNFNPISPYSHLGFRTKYIKTINDVKIGKSVSKTTLTPFTVGGYILKAVLLVGESILEGLSELLGDSKTIKNELNIYKEIVAMLNDNKISDTTKDKGGLDIARMDFIDKIPEEFREMLQEDINALLALNEKYTKGDLKGEYNGETCVSKIDRILDRVSVMRESIRTRYMFNKSPENNINFEDAINEGKVIVIKMRQDLSKKQKKTPSIVLP